MSDALKDIQDAEKRLKAIEEEAAANADKREKLKQQKAALEKKLQSLGGSKSDKKRKERNHKLIMAGALVDMAGLLDVDKGFLLGWLLSARNKLNDEVEFHRVKEMGDNLFQQRMKKTGEGA